MRILRTMPEPVVSTALQRIRAAAVARPVVPLVVVAGFALVALFLFLAYAGTSSAYGCIDREAGRAEAKDIAEHRQMASALRFGALENYYRDEARRQQERNADAERRCGQPGMTFDLAMRRIDAKQDLLGVASTLIFGFCTLASVLVAVTLADEARSVAGDRSGGRDGADEPGRVGVKPSVCAIDGHGELSFGEGRSPDPSSHDDPEARRPRDAGPQPSPEANDFLSRPVLRTPGWRLVLVSGAIASTSVFFLRSAWPARFLVRRR